MSDFATIVAAALWGAAAGALLPRAAYRFSAPAGEPWHHLCPSGHPVRRWLGPAHCTACVTLPGDPGPLPTEAPPPNERPGIPANGPRTDGRDSNGAGANGSYRDGPDANGPGANGPGANGPGANGPDTNGPATDDSAANGPYPDRLDANGPAAPDSADTDSPDANGAAADGPYPDGRVRRGGGVGRYGPRGPVLAGVTALLCAALAAATGTRPELGVWLLLAPVGVLLAVVDLRVRRLPDPLTLPLAAATLGLLALAALVPEHAGHWLTALYGALALGGGYFVLFLINPGGMGFGDVKLALGAGAALGWYGWPTLLLGTFAGFLFGAVYAGALVAGRRADRKTAIPFGPFLIAGAYAGVLIGAYTA
ncbi:prepilin peptidase [Streptomyces sp. NPDC001508]|uniref:prepilin peptidase n=1 Tax=Streptomyces sp. NPDC001508 TaxID=3154656 RepID=UPI00331FB872